MCLDIKIFLAVLITSMGVMVIWATGISAHAVFLSTVSFCRWHLLLKPNVQNGLFIYTCSPSA